MTDPTSEPPGRPDRVGPYKLLELLGEGGMGEVWLAEQTEPVHRRVALKVIKLGMDTKQVLARLEAERQALAVMDHPNIARFYDGGATETGRPYFVMELVQGIPITEYSDTNRLTTDERIRLFIDVCQAVQHAHHKGVVHRDLKPSNVLVTVKDNKPVVKIIDFGIAKALGQDLTDQTLVTRMGQIIGTPEYMSPEQAEMAGLDVDTRTDVYSLGVMLYELLVGARPLDLRAPADEAIRYAIRETQVPKPSTRLTSLGETQETIAEYRRTNVDALRKELKSDLDWIILKAMEKDRTRRYETANGFAQDLERHLKHEPVLAHAPSARYRLKKYVRRHRVGMAASAAVVVALVVGLSLATVGMVRAQRAEGRAGQEAEAARQVSDFLVELFQVSDPSEARGNTITAREILDRGAERIESELAEQPLIQARMQHTIGTVYHALGIDEEAIPLLEKALVTRKAALPSHHLDVAETSDAIGRALAAQGRFDEAEQYIQDGLEIREEALGSSDLKVAESIQMLAFIRLQERDYERAKPLLDRVLEIRESLLGPNDPGLAPTLNNLGAFYYRQGQWEDAEPFFRRALEIRERMLGPDHPDLASSLNSMGAIYWSLGDFEKARTMFERAVDLFSLSLGPEHPTTAVALASLGSALRSLGRLADAEEVYRKATEINNKVLDPGHPETGLTLSELAGVIGDQGRFEESDSLFLSAIRMLEESLPSNDPEFAGVLEDYSTILRRLGRIQESDTVMDRVKAIRGGGG